MGWGGVGWDGMGWDGMGCDGMGWDGRACYFCKEPQVRVETGVLYFVTEMGLRVIPSTSFIPYIKLLYHEDRFNLLSLENIDFDRIKLIFSFCTV